MMDLQSARPRRPRPHSTVATLVAAALLVLAVGCDGKGNGKERPDTGSGADTAPGDTAPQDTLPSDTRHGGPTDTAPDAADAPGDTLGDTPGDTSGDTRGDTIGDAAGDTSRDAHPDTAPGTVRLQWDFANGAQGWVSSYTDYSPGMPNQIDFVGELRQLPSELNKTGTGYFLGGTNTPDDLFMFLKRVVGAGVGLQPSTDYNMKWTIEFASNEASGCVGIGGAPGESVYLKAGGSATEPKSVLAQEDNRYTLNVDKGNQSQSGANASVVGHIANGIPCNQDMEEYVKLTKTHTHPRPVTTDSNGRLWVMVGTDSGFEGRTELYYMTLTVELTPASTP